MEGCRAQSVAYALAWLAQKSEQRIDLERIWREQRLPPLLCETIKVVSAAAHEHITGQGGNPGEVAKREQCWRDFSATRLTGLPDWKSEWAGFAFIPASSDEESMARTWEMVRKAFISDPRPVGELAAQFNVDWPNGRWGHPLADYAKLTWSQLQNKSAFGLKKQRAILEILKSASQQV